MQRIPLRRGTSVQLEVTMRRSASPALQAGRSGADGVSASASAKACIALKLIGDAPEAPHMARARMIGFGM
jgi:hypothetical protein